MKRKRTNLKHLTPDEKKAHKKLKRQQLPIEVKAERSRKQAAWYQANKEDQCLKAKKKYHERKRTDE